MKIITMQSPLFMLLDCIPYFKNIHFYESSNNSLEVNLRFKIKIYFLLLKQN